MLNSESPLPLYHQLAKILMDDIHTGNTPPGSRIPSETVLARRYGIGRPTARQAVDVLVRKGLVKRRRGAGTFVCEKAEAVDLFSLVGTTSAFQRQGVSVDIRIITPIGETTVASDDKDNPFAGGRALCLSRLTATEDDPILLETIFLHAGLFKGIEQMDLTGRSLSQVVSEQFYMTPRQGRQHFQVATANPAQARLLDLLPDTPVLLVKRFLDFPQADNAVYAELLCRTDRFVFSQTIGGVGGVQGG